jgi:phosphotransferase system enzyme I (PtsI)
MMEKHFAGRRRRAGIALGALFPLTIGTCVRVTSGSATSEAEALRAALNAALVDLRGAHRAIERERRRRSWNSRSRCSRTTRWPSAAFVAIAEGAAADLAWLTSDARGDRRLRRNPTTNISGRAQRISTTSRDRVVAHLDRIRDRSWRTSRRHRDGADLTPSRFLAIDWSRGGGARADRRQHDQPRRDARALAGHSRRRGPGVDLAEHSGDALIDAHRGLLIVNPGPAARAQFERDAEAAASTRTLAAAAALLPAVTADGTPIRIMLNIADPRELAALDPAICDGIGLVRTEFCSTTAWLPDEEHQYAVYRRIAEWAQGRPVVIPTRSMRAATNRSRDSRPREREQPVPRCARLALSLAHPDVFRTQLRALSRAAVHGNVKIMLPMVTHPRELAIARGYARRRGRRVASGGRRVPTRKPRHHGRGTGRRDCRRPVRRRILLDRLERPHAIRGCRGRDIGAVADLADPTQPAMLRCSAGWWRRRARNGSK